MIRARPRRGRNSVIGPCLVGGLALLAVGLVLARPQAVTAAPASSSPAPATLGVREGAHQDQEGAGAPTVVEAVVTAILAENDVEILGEVQYMQRLELRIDTGPRAGERVVVEQGDAASANGAHYTVGDRVLAESTPDGQGGDSFYVTDRVRRGPLLALFGLFVGLTLLVGRRRGLASLLALAFTFLVIFAFLLPRIAAGDDPILAAIASALVIIPVTFYMSHGINRKTTVAVIGTLVSLMITGLLATLFVEVTQLTGYASEEASFIQSLRPGAVNIRGLLLAGIIVGLAGILDDITISQAAIVEQLRDAAEHLSPAEIYRRAMDVGRDHIASLVNTLILVYASSAMPLLLLFTYSGASPAEVVNYEIVAEEIVRTLVASIGLILAVPVTTAVACVALGWGQITRPPSAKPPA